MALHDWPRSPAGLFHDFQQTWAIQIKLVLNAGILPKGLSALVEQPSIRVNGVERHQLMALPVIEDSLQRYSRERRKNFR
jgi:hypothetical protein